MQLEQKYMNEHLMLQFPHFDTAIGMATMAARTARTPSTISTIIHTWLKPGYLRWCSKCVLSLLIIIYNQCSYSRNFRKPPFWPSENLRAIPKYRSAPQNQWQSQNNLHWFEDLELVNFCPVFVLNAHTVPGKDNRKTSLEWQVGVLSCLICPQWPCCDQIMTQRDPLLI